MPFKAQIYVVGVYVLGLLAGAGAVLAPGPASRGEAWEMALFLLLGVAAGSKHVHLSRNKDVQSNIGSMSLGFVLTFAAMLHFGPATALLVGVSSTLLGCLFNKWKNPAHQPIHQLVFNVAVSAVETWVSGWVFLALNDHGLTLDAVHSFPAVIASCLSYFFINTGLVAGVLALCMDKPVFALWRQTFAWTVFSYFAGACVSTLAMILSGNHVGAVVLYTAPVAVAGFYFYAVYTGRTEDKEKYIENLQLSQAQLADLYLATIKSLALAIDAKDQYTHQHILRVQRYAVATAVEMGLTGNELEGVNTGALLHDIGKLGVPEYVLLKPGRLTDEEFAKIKEHPRIGADILSPVEFPWPVLPAVKYHHEKWDGTGYPEGLAGENIPLPGRILAVADVYDALTSTRSYRNAWTHEKAIEVIRKDSGTHFDPRVVQAFMAVIDGIVSEMASEGYGPLAARTGAGAAAASPAASRADAAARDIQRASGELWALYEVAQTLSSSLGLQETLDILSRKLEAILPGTACLFLLREGDDDALSVRTVVGVNHEFFAGCRTLGPGSTSVSVAARRETFRGAYDSDDLMLNGVPGTPWTPLHASLIVPIVHQEQVLGTINLYHPEPDAFGAHDQQLLEMIAQRAALALYNGLLFDRTRSHALTDPLTGLYNVRYLTQWVDERCARAAATAAAAAAAPAAPFALLCLDLDSFKPINDNFGHQKGDQVLADLGRLFREAVRKDDIVARYGGDEFLVVLEGANRAEAEAMAERLRATVENYDPGLLHPRLGALRLGVSVGSACFPADGTDCATLLSIADANMYQTKTERKLGRLASAIEPAPLRLAA